MSQKHFWFELAEMLAVLEEKDANKLHPAEMEFANSLLSIARKYGKLSDGDEKGIWVGYESPEENKDASIGVRCGNCYLHESEKVCKIASVEIDPYGKCRLAVIPRGVVKMNGGSDDDYDSHGNNEPHK